MARPRKPVDTQIRHNTQAEIQRQKFAESLVQTGREDLTETSIGLMDATARKEYARVLRSLVDLPVIGNLDRTNLVGYCNYYSLHRKLEGKIKKQEAQIKKEEKELGEASEETNAIYFELLRQDRLTCESMIRFEKLCGLTLDALLEAADRQSRELAFLPRWEARQLDLTAAYNQRMREAGKKGYGMFAKHHVFTVENGQLVPVKYPDPQKLSELPGYEKEREKVIANTRALLAGSPANNVLLYGDAGTGKSSTVKAIANEYAADGLRLVEVKKNQLYQIPDLMDQLAANPLKFILFIDDLSFSSNDDNFAALKAILEGSVGGRARNIAVYATSNRRHLIKETLTDRTGDDIHEADTRQELMSLSARFGLTVTFQRPEKARFETILEELARQHHIQMPMDQLLVKAEAFAIRAGGRSPRVAKQFIEQCEAGVQK